MSSSRPSSPRFGSTSLAAMPSFRAEQALEAVPIELGGLGAPRRPCRLAQPTAAARSPPPAAPPHPAQAEQPPAVSSSGGSHGAQRRASTALCHQGETVGLMPSSRVACWCSSRPLPCAACVVQQRSLETSDQRPCSAAPCRWQTALPPCISCMMCWACARCGTRSLRPAARRPATARTAACGARR